MVTLTKPEFIAKMQEFRGASMGTIVWHRTLKDRELKAPKTNGTSGRIAKSGKTMVVFNHTYGSSVNRQRLREGRAADFQPNQRKWGERIEGTTLVYHKGRHYLEVKVERALQTQWWLDGKPVDLETVKPYLSKKSWGNEDTAEHQGTAKAVILRDFDVDNIHYVNAMGETIVLC
jgi:hypothetical protein